jgi:hypothetical protein
MSDIATRVKEIIVDKLGVDESEVTPEASLKKNSILEFLTIRQRPSAPLVMLSSTLRKMQSNFALLITHL